MPAKLTKTQSASDALIGVGGEVKNRQHAWVIVKDAGLASSQRVVNKAIAEYERHFNVTLGDSKAVRRQKAKLEEQVRKMSSGEVWHWLRNNHTTTPLFWTMQRLQKDGMWEGELSSADFQNFIGKSRRRHGST